MDSDFEIFLVAPPGLEPHLAAEARAAGFDGVTEQPGGVILRSSWAEAMRANLDLRGAVRVLVRFASFRAMHLAQLDKRARKVDWASLLRPDVPVRVEAVCRASRIYHHKAAAQRIGRAITETLGAPLAEDAAIRILARIDDDLCTLSIDTTGEPLHKRGHKEFVGKAPLRESMAAMFLAECGFDGTQPVIDPMCGSGTFVIEAAEIAAGLQPGRSRAFAFEQTAVFDATALAALRRPAPDRTAEPRFLGFDRDQGAIRGAQSNAARAGLADWCRFACQPLSALERPEGPPGLVMVNPPYGARIGDRKQLFGLYGALGTVLKERFAGWRVGIVTSDAGLAKATGLSFLDPGPQVAHGGLKVQLWRTAPLP